MSNSFKLYRNRRWGLSVWKTTEVQVRQTLETKRLHQAASISQHDLDRARSKNKGWASGSLGEVKSFTAMDFYGFSVELQGRSHKARVGVCPCYFPGLIILASNSSAGRQQLIVFHHNHCALSAGNLPRLSLKFIAQLSTERYSSHCYGTTWDNCVLVLPCQCCRFGACSLQVPPEASVIGTWSQPSSTPSWQEWDILRLLNSFNGTSHDSSVICFMALYGRYGRVCQHSQCWDES